MPDAETLHDRRRARKRWRAFAVFVGVAGVELGLALLLGQVKGRAPQTSGPQPPPVEVLLYQPPPISLEPPAPETGGGAPAAPSRIHTPPPPKQVRPVELPAPPKQAPEPAPVVGIAPAPSPQPGFGQGGQGSGSGSGVGSGSGPGAGSTRARVVRSPPVPEIRANHPRAARSRYGNAALSCVVRLDQRLEDCRVISETPAGLGFGEAALRLVDQFRVQPPTEDGRPVEGQRLVVGIDFGNRPR
jgi:periplasmic protein TonB